MRLERVGLNPTRVGLLGILNRMGAAIEVEEDPTDGGEPRGTIVARHSPLTATRVHPEEVPVAIDELPLVALLGCFAEGRTVVSGAGELRHKESDRIASVVDGLRGVGRRDRGDRRRLRRRRHGRPSRRRRSTRAATTASRCWAPSRAWPRARGSRSAWARAAGQLPALRGGPGLARTLGEMRRFAASSARWGGPGRARGRGGSSRRASSVARTSWRSLGSNSARSRARR